MIGEIPKSKAWIFRQAILRALVAFPVACFTSALATDLAYVQTANMMWADFSAWLLAVGIGVGVLAAIVGIIDFMVTLYQRTRGVSWTLVVGCLVVLILALFNNLVHSRDAWTSVMPTGLLLSAVTVVAMLVTAGLVWARVDRTDDEYHYLGAR